MIEKEKLIDRKEILENGVIQIREVTRVIENGKILSQNFNRYVLSPGDNISNQPQSVIDICSLIWTTEVISSYKSSLKQNNIIMNKT